VAVQLAVAPQLFEICSHPIAILPVPMSNVAAGAVVPIPTCPPNRASILDYFLESILQVCLKYRLRAL